MQRAVILLRAKKVDFDTTYINLREKPDWFLKISPHGKVPVLVVDEQPLFESSAIAEFLDEVVEPRLHPEDPIKRARNRAWTDYVPTFAGAMSKVTYAGSKEALETGVEEAAVALGRLEEALTSERGNDGPFFNGEKMSLVDASYAPFLHRFTLVEPYLKTGLLDRFPLVKAWRDALLATDAVKGSVAPEFDDAFRTFLKRRETYAGEMMEAA